MTKKWKIAIDTGGTFTDCLATSPDGRILRRKVLSTGRLRGIVQENIDERRLIVSEKWEIRTDILRGYSFRLLRSADSVNRVLRYLPEHGELTLEYPLHKDIRNEEFEIFANEEAPVLATRLITETPLGDSFPDFDLRLGSTRGTNALLEKKGTLPLLITTEGFADLPLIGDQQRPDLFSLNVQKPAPLFHHVIEVRERIDAHGNKVVPLTESEINRVLRQVYRLNPGVVVIAFLNSYVNPGHEQTFMNLLRTAGYKYISASSHLERVVRFLPRLQTSLVNGYLQPVMDDYLKNIRDSLQDKGTIRIMTSSGGLVSSGLFKPKDSLLSGPAGGVAGAAAISEKLGLNGVLAFDMGGTSTDVSRYKGEYDYVFETKIGDQQILSPSLLIETVAAGGGSVCNWDGFKLTVGPESAGADPGPACYAHGGPLTITDVNLLLGRLNASMFGIPISREQALEQLHLVKSSDEKLMQLRDEEILTGFLDIANEKMAKTIERISLRRGYEPSSYCLLAFGGAGGMHACDIAEILDMETVVVPFDAGVLSAYGIKHSGVEQVVTRQVLQPLSNIAGRISLLFDEMNEEGRAILQKEGIDAANINRVRALVLARFRGQDECIEIEYSPEIDIAKAFEDNYRQQFGHYLSERIVEVESLRLVMRESIPKPTLAADSSTVSHPEPAYMQPSLVAGEWKDTPVFLLDSFLPGTQFSGPAVVLSDIGTTYVQEGWEVNVNADRDMILKHQKDLSGKGKNPQGSAPRQVQLELFTNRFRAVAADMGALLQRTAFSVNIKERLDFSCALLDADGYLVVNAPHIPVHLGAMGICVRSLLKHVEIGPGDVLVTNYPVFGGSHLPDVTMVAPVYIGDCRVAFVANRAHHAELGGISPGSMPARASSLAEEGVVIPPVHVARGGKVDFSEIRRILSGAPYPSRSPEENLADLEAALASIRKGIEQVKSLCDMYGTEQVVQYMYELAAFSGNTIDNKLNELLTEPRQATEKLDDGSVLSVSIFRDNDKVTISFAGTAAQHPANMNATPAIVQSVILYVLRLLVDENIPLNEGLLRRINIDLPRCLLNPEFDKDPAKCPAVVGGNVEVSQRLVDTLLKAFEIAACSQGTMNNLLFGNEKFGFYETISGGVGATEGYKGASGVHQHMTNTRITDPEIMELRYPVRVEEFSLRTASGGGGRWNGGDGVVRKLRFLEPVSLTLLSQHRVEVPYGMRNGKPGKPGEQYLITHDGGQKPLNGIDAAELNAGDIFVIKTPGGGGFGEPERDE